MQRAGIKVVHCKETGSRQLTLWAQRVEGKTNAPMQVGDPGIGIENACTAKDFAFPAGTEFNLIVGIICRTTTAKRKLEGYLERSFYREREQNQELKFADYLTTAPELELISLRDEP